MKQFVFALVSAVTLLCAPCVAQSGAIIPEHGSGHATQPTCVILKRMGPADEVTSHLYSFGIRGKQFQYIEGKFPDGFPFHGRMTDHDVRNLQARGTEVLVLESHYTGDDLKQARADCRGETGKTPNQSEAKATPAEAPAVDPPLAAAAAAEKPVGAASAAAPTSAPAATPASSASAKLSVTSAPVGADIMVDGNFVGNTPSDVQIPEGEHTVVVKKSGFKDWERKMKISGGSNVHLNAEMEVK
jgi:hypothetical protein